MIKKKLLSIAIAFSLLFTIYMGLAPSSFAADLTSDFSVSVIEVAHEDGSAITPTKPLKNGHNITASITGAFDRKDVYVGDTMLIPIVASSPVKLSLAGATPWVDLSYGSEGVIGRFRVNESAEVEVEITKDTNNLTDLTFNLGNTIRVNKIPVQNGVQTGTISALDATQTVYFKNVANIRLNYGVNLRKTEVNKGSDFVRWTVLTNTKSLRKLYKKEPIINYKNVYIEDEFSGNSEVSLNEIKAIIYCPLNLTDPEPWEMGNRSYSIVIPSANYTKVTQNQGESYVDLKSRLGDFEYAIYEDNVANKKRFVINFGELNENTPFTLDGLNSNWVQDAASTWINKQYYDESDRADLEARIEEVFGNSNQVNGHAIAFNVKLTESFDPVLFDVVKSNTAEMSAIIDPNTPFNTSSTDSTAIAGINGSIDLEADEVALLKVDKANNPIPGAEIELQKKDGTNWVTVGSSKLTDSEGKVIFDGLSINDNDHYRLVEINAPIPFDKDSVVFRNLNGDIIDNGEFDNYSDPLVIVATNDVLKRDIQVAKVWNDNNNPNRPTSVTITLVKNGVDTDQTLVLNNANNWQGTFNNLIQYDGQDEITYTIKEDGVAANDSYTVEVTGNQESGFTVTNTKVSETHKLGDYVWYDGDNNGVQDTDEIGVEGVTVTLTKPNGEVETTTTNEDGYYEFADLENGDYEIAFTNLPKGYIPTASNVGGDDTKDSNGLTTTATIADADNMTLDLGIYKKTYKIGDYVWIDENYNGIQDENEVGVEGVTVTLYKPDGEVEETITDENGHYEFDNLPNGEYYVDFIYLPKGFVATKTDEGSDDSIDSDSVIAKGIIDYADNMTLDLGIVQKSKLPGYNNGDFKLGDYVWYDLDGDGIQDSNEGGVENVTVTLTAPDGEKFVTTTDATGHYVFENMKNGEYKIEFTNLPEGYKSTLKNKDSDDSKDSDGLVTTGVIENADNMTLDLGVVKKAALPKTGSGSSSTLYMIIGLILVAGGILYFWKGKKSSK